MKLRQRPTVYQYQLKTPSLTCFKIKYEIADSGIVSGHCSGSNFNRFKCQNISFTSSQTSQVCWTLKCSPKFYSLNSKKPSITETSKTIHLCGFHLASLCLCVHICLYARGKRQLGLSANKIMTGDSLTQAAHCVHRNNSWKRHN